MYPLIEFTLHLQGNQAYNIPVTKSFKGWLNESWNICVFKILRRAEYFSLLIFSVKADHQALSLSRPWLVAQNFHNIMWIFNEWVFLVSLLKSLHLWFNDCWKKWTGNKSSSNLWKFERSTSYLRYTHFHILLYYFLREYLWSKRCTRHKGMSLWCDHTQTLHKGWKVTFTIYPIFISEIITKKDFRLPLNF